MADGSLRHLRRVIALLCAVPVVRVELKLVFLITIKKSTPAGDYAFKQGTRNWMIPENSKSCLMQRAHELLPRFRALEIDGLYDHALLRCTSCDSIVRCSRLAVTKRIVRAT